MLARLLHVCQKYNFQVTGMSHSLPSTGQMKTPCWPTPTTSSCPMLETRHTLKLPQSQSALALFDHFEGQLTPRVQDVLDTNNILVVGIPANCTDRLQPMDLSINKPFKDHMKTSFQMWYAQQVCLQLQQKQVHKVVDLSLSIVKPLSTHWITAAFAHVQGNP